MPPREAGAEAVMLAEVPARSRCPDLCTRQARDGVVAVNLPGSADKEYAVDAICRP